MVVWKPVNKFGVVIWNYRPESNQSVNLSLLIGEPVHICDETQDWYHGYSLTSDSDKRGIFPKSYTAVQDYETKSTNKYGEVYFKYTFEQEAIFTLREWSKFLKEIYINGDQVKFNTSRELIFEVILCYQRLVSGILTSDEMKSLRNEIIEKIDLGNKLLGLDLKIRDNDGFVINPLETNIIEYFEFHQIKEENVQKCYKGISVQNEFSYDREAKRNSMLRNSLSNNSVGIIPNGNEFSQHNYNYSICVALVNFICTIRQDMDLLMSIYDAKENRFIRENYKVKWDKGGLMSDIDKLNNIRIVFTDLSANDLNRKLFLVCQVIRVGTMNIEYPRHQYRKNMNTNPKKIFDEVKRPCGIAVYDLSDLLNRPGEYDANKEIFFPFIPYYEKDSLDSLIRKFTKDSKDQNKDSPKSQGFRISIKLVSSYKMQLAEQHSAYPSYISRKIGFPDIILPEDVRNDLYLTIVSGEFHKGTKKSERNIEVSIKVFDEQGKLIEGCLSVGADNAMQSVYKSVVYYHEDRPKWMENVKISLSIENFSNCHLKFTFKHRSSNENKDRNEKPFAIAFIRLMNENGTTLNDNEFDLFVYKVDAKKYNDSDITYLALPSSKYELKGKYGIDSNDHYEMKQLFNKKLQSNIYNYSLKDIFTISIVVCSTKLAQNINIFGLLNWKEKKDLLETILDNVQKLDGGDVVKFLYDTLNALFEIWMDDSISQSFDHKVFEALIYIIRLLLQKKYMHFQKMLNDYIDKHFSATLIYTKLIDCFKYYIENPDSEFTYKAVTCMQNIFKFIVQSRTLFSNMNGDKDKEDFESSLGDLLRLITKLVENCDEKLVTVKSGILKYFPCIITDIMTVFDEKKLSRIIVELIQDIPIDQLTLQTLTCIHQLVYTDLFTNYSECRRDLLPVITLYVQANFRNGSAEATNDLVNDKLKRCLAIVSDILRILNQQESRVIRNDISVITVSLLQTMLDTFMYVENMPIYRSYLQKLWSIIISLFYQMTEFHYNDFFRRFKSNDDLKFFLLKLLRLFKNSSKSIYPEDWSDMNIFQNIVILRTTNQIISCIKGKIDYQKFNIQLWREIFLTAISFITQKSIQLEKFSKLKRVRIESLCKDMRLEMTVTIRSLWYNIGDFKKEFVPSIIGPLLEVALIPVLLIRQNSIVIFFDMFYSCFEDSKIIRNEVITQLDYLITTDKGDLQFKELFEKTILKYCENLKILYIKEECLKFVSEVSQQIEMLMVYREVVKNSDNYESLMSSIIVLLDFYDLIDRKEMYIRYLYKLYDLHIKCENYIEAAYTLSKHAMLLEWSDKPLESLLRNDKYKKCNTHRELKEKLYYEIIENFNTGQLWEAGIIYCKELIQQYENVFYDYCKLSQLFTKMSEYFSLIVSRVRMEPEYFHVTYYGNGFTSFFQGKSFIYRGKSYERLSDFTKRLQNQFPNAKLLDKLVADDQIVNSNGQYLSIFRVDPTMNESVKNKFNSTSVDEKIIKYYQVNEINEFTFSRPIHKQDKSGLKNEFACMWIERSEFRTAFTLPGILCRSEVCSKNVYELNPLKNAIDTMMKVNDKTRSIINRFISDHENTLPLHILIMHINGIVNSDVQGGVSKYEEAFFQNLDENDDEYDIEDLEKLKELISNQIPLLDLAIKVIDDKQKRHSNQENMDGLYKYIVESFQKMKEDIDKKYGKGDLPADLKMKEHLYNSIESCTNNRFSTSTSKSNENRNSFDNSNTSTLSKSRSIFSRANGSTTNLSSTLRFRKKDPSRRMNLESSNSVYASNANLPQTQWYTDHQKSIGNLTDISDSASDMSFDTFDRKSTSRPNSGHYSHRASIQSNISLMYRCNTNSLSSLLVSPPILNGDSDLPPPLPVKQSVISDNTNQPNKKPNHNNSANTDDPIKSSDCNIYE